MDINRIKLELSKGLKMPIPDVVWDNLLNDMKDRRDEEDFEDIINSDGVVIDFKALIKSKLNSREYNMILSGAKYLKYFNFGITEGRLRKPRGEYKTSLTKRIELFDFIHRKRFGIMPNGDIVFGRLLPAYNPKGLLYLKQDINWKSLADEWNLQNKGKPLKSHAIKRRYYRCWKELRKRFLESLNHNNINEAVFAKVYISYILSMAEQAKPIDLMQYT